MLSMCRPWQMSPLDAWREDLVKPEQSLAQNQTFVSLHLNGKLQPSDPNNSTAWAEDLEKQGRGVAITDSEEHGLRLLGTETSFSVFVSRLRQCHRSDAFLEGKRVHAHIIESGYEGNRVLANLLVQMYGKCERLEEARIVFNKVRKLNTHSWTMLFAAHAQNGNMDEARTLFARMPRQDTVSWTAMITACDQNGRANEALEFFARMQGEGIQPSKVTYVCVLGACAHLASSTEGESIHCSVVDRGYESDMVVGAALVHLYSKLGNLNNARIVFSKLSQRDVVCWSAMISASIQNGHGKEALELFLQMAYEGVKPNHVTYIAILGAFISHRDLVQGQEIHVRIVENGLESSIGLGAALISMYGRCGSLDDARTLFGKMPDHDVVSWNAMISACAQMGNGKEALNLFHQLQREGVNPDENTYISILGVHASMALLSEGQEVYARIVEDGFECDAFVGTALINMFGKCGSVDDARHVFDKLPDQDLVSGSAMMAAYTQNEHSNEALELFQQMHSDSFRLDKVCFISILDACVNLAELKEGKEIHASIVNHGYDSDIMVGTGLIRLYGKCGSLDDAKTVFENMPVQDVISWSAIITVCAQNGYGKLSLELFCRMQSEGIQPNGISFQGVLSACSHTGLVEEGKTFFASMMKD